MSKSNLDLSQYRVVTNGEEFSVEMPNDTNEYWVTVDFRGGQVYRSGAGRFAAYFRSEKEAVRVAETVLGTQVRRIREWRVV